jgi:hypothetical protein
LVKGREVGIFFWKSFGQMMMQQLFAVQIFEFFGGFRTSNCRGRTEGQTSLVLARVVAAVAGPKKPTHKQYTHAHIIKY